MKTKKVLILGGSGFIGKNLVSSFKNKYIIKAPSSKQLNLLNNKDVYKFIKNGKFDVIVYAANKGGNPKLGYEKDFFKQNLLMFTNVLNCEEHYKKMIFLGSGSEYSKQRDLKNVKESSFGEYIPTDDYGYYKYLASKLISSHHKVVNLRCFGVFGEHENYEFRFISSLIVSYLFKKKFIIKQNAFFNYIDVKDLIKIIEFFINNSTKHQFYNVGSKARISLLSIANKINKLDNYSVPFEVIKNGYNFEYSGDTKLLQNELTFEVRPIDESLLRLYKWYKSQKNTLDYNKIEFFLYNK